jgi:mRNA interferase RelE/StbE
MRQATEVYSREFDARFLQLPLQMREQIEAKIRELGRRLESFPHHRLQGQPEFRLRAGDYRIIYEYNVQQNELFLVTLGHRREVYRH